MRAIVNGLIMIVKVLIIGVPIIGVLLVVAPMTVIAPFILLDQAYRRLVPYPPLVRDVPSPEEFAKRVRTAFPIGSRHIDLISRLKDEGFKPDGLRKNFRALAGMRLLAGRAFIASGSLG